MIVCFDIGGSFIKGAYVDDPKQITEVPRIATPVRDFTVFVSALKMVIDQAPQRPKMVSISIAGVVHRQHGRIQAANIPCISGRRLADDLKQALALPVIITNDADCFALSEALLGAGRNHHVVFGAILGTGIGGGLVVGGELVNKSGGAAGEWGHGPVAATLAGTTPLQIARFQCGCGLVGCLETVVSARGLEKLHTHFHDKRLSAEEILAAWHAKDSDAVLTLDVYLDLLTGPLAMIINTTSATVVPVGGGLSNDADLVAAIDQQVRAKIMMETSTPIVVQAHQNVEPGLTGAALIAQQAYQYQNVINI